MAEGHIYLFGLGSPHGADRLGWLAAEWLHAALAGRDGLTVDTLGQPTDLFLHPVTARDRLLLVDAMRGQGPPGTVMAFAPDALPEGVGALSTHGLDLASTLALVEALGVFRAGIRIIGIEMPSAAGQGAIATTLPAPLAKRLRTAVLAWLDAPGTDRARGEGHAKA
ncbi:hydrogenase maturation protease [Halomonas cerina]|uniref:Hydrogenase maturation protease n=1 Tax=Halomonas cerina TaxID=447424 RepID=A0A839VDY4_9GAMM|nr:hydrogenase maturation protease [Halomonas cerina]MBB3190686.1 hydrogenase maturation protease [Halomonas cerina]